jgi:hypothetical protein
LGFLSPAPQAEGLGFSLSLPSSLAPQEEPQADGLGFSLSLPSSPAPQEDPHEPPAAIAVNPVLIKLRALFLAKNFSSPPFHAPNKFSLLMAKLLENLFYKKAYSS